MELNKRLKLAGFFLSLAEWDRHIEVIRQVMNSLDQFEPYAAFLRITKGKSNCLRASDICNFLIENGNTMDVSHAGMIIRLFDRSLQGRLDFGDFLRMVLTRDNPEMRFQSALRPNYDVVGQENVLAAEIEYALSRFFKKATDFLLRLRGEEETGLLIRDKEWVFRQVETDGIIGFESLKAFFEDTKILPKDSEIVAVLRVIDINEDGLISRDEFDYFANLFSDKLPDDQVVHRLQSKQWSEANSREHAPLKSHVSTANTTTHIHKQTGVTFGGASHKPSAHFTTEIQEKVIVPRAEHHRRRGDGSFGETRSREVIIEERRERTSSNGREDDVVIRKTLISTTGEDKEKPWSRVTAPKVTNEVRTQEVVEERRYASRAREDLDHPSRPARRNSPKRTTEPPAERVERIDDSESKTRYQRVRDFSRDRVPVRDYSRGRTNEEAVPTEQPRDREREASRENRRERPPSEEPYNPNRQRSDISNDYRSQNAVPRDRRRQERDRSIPKVTQPMGSIDNVNKKLDKDAEIRLAGELRKLVELEKTVESCKQELSLRPDFSVKDVLTIMARGNNQGASQQDFINFCSQIDSEDNSNRSPKLLEMLYREGDYDADGFISITDLQTLLCPRQKEYKVLLMCRPERAQSANADITKLWSADTRRSLSSLLSALAERLHVHQTVRTAGLFSPQEMENLFSSLDNDKDGYIDKVELKDFLAKNNTLLTKRDQDVLFQWIDEDQDGKITMRNLKNIFFPN
jgi:Ca2+-binding EF-hand superfamily protein